MPQPTKVLAAGARHEFLIQNLVTKEFFYVFEDRILWRGEDLRQFSQHSPEYFKAAESIQLYVSICM